jgi:hypothetical protein
MAAWVKKYDLDGIDVDYEDFDAFDGSSGSAVPWLNTFTQQLRVHLPQGSYVLTHARVLFLSFSKNLRSDHMHVTSCCTVVPARWVVGGWVPCH